MNAVEPIADVVSGGLAARAIEPNDGVDRTGHTAEHACLNCGAELVGDYCHRCGQHGHVHRSLGAFAHDLLHGVFHFEGKIWRTLPMLAWRPGDLTRSYIDGKRATYVGPLPLFLFGVFLMFAMVSQLGGKLAFPSEDNVKQGMAAQVKEDEAKIAALEKQRVAAAAAGNSAEATALANKIIKEREDLALAKRIATEGTGEAIASSSDGFSSNLDAINSAYRKAKKNPELLLYKLKSNGYKYSWALIPLSLPLMWLLFPFSRRYRMYDHTVFVTYSLCFMTLLVVVGTLWRLTGLGFTGLLLLIPPIHMYRQLRGAYSLSRFSAGWRTIVLSSGAAVIALLFAITLVVMGIYD